MKPITVRWVTAADIDAFYDGHPEFLRRHTVTAMAGEVDGAVVAIGGVAHTHGVLVAFYDYVPEARPYKVALVKAARRLIASIPENRLVVAQADPGEPGAARWIESLGFVPLNSSGLYKLASRNG